MTKCKECGGTGKIVLFTTVEECDACKAPKGYHCDDCKCVHIAGVLFTKPNDRDRFSCRYCFEKELLGGTRYDDKEFMDEFVRQVESISPGTKVTVIKP